MTCLCLLVVDVNLINEYMNKRFFENNGFVYRNEFNSSYTVKLSERYEYVFSYCEEWYVEVGLY